METGGGRHWRWRWCHQIGAARWRDQRRCRFKNWCRSTTGAGGVQVQDQKLVQVQDQALLVQVQDQALLVQVQDHPFTRSRIRHSTRSRVHSTRSRIQAFHPGPIRHSTSSRIIPIPGIAPPPIGSFGPIAQQAFRQQQGHPFQALLHHPLDRLVP